MGNLGFVVDLFWIWECRLGFILLEMDFGVRARLNVLMRILKILMGILACEFDRFCYFLIRWMGNGGFVKSFFLSDILTGEVVVGYVCGNSIFPYIKEKIYFLVRLAIF